MNSISQYLVNTSFILDTVLHTFYEFSHLIIKVTSDRCYYLITISQMKRPRHATFIYLFQDNGTANLTNSKPKIQTLNTVYVSLAPASILPYCECWLTLKWLIEVLMAYSSYPTQSWICAVWTPEWGWRAVSSERRQLFLIHWPGGARVLQFS